MYSYKLKTYLIFILAIILVSLYIYFNMFDPISTVYSANNSTIVAEIKLNKYSGIENEFINIEGVNFSSNLRVEFYILNKQEKPKCDEVINKGSSLAAVRSSNRGRVHVEFKVFHEDFIEHNISYICATDKERNSNVIKFTIKPSAEYNLQNINKDRLITITIFNFYGFVDNIIINDKYEWNNSRNDDFSVTKENNGRIHIYSFILPKDLNTSVRIVLYRIKLMVNIDFTLSNLPDALGNNIDKIERIFYFNNIKKEWLFYDTRSYIKQYSTLKELVIGEIYWVLVLEPINNKILNNKIRNLTCTYDSCWNVLVW